MNERECTGNHHYFVANDATYEGRIFVLLVCTACGTAKKIEFGIAPKGALVEVEQKGK